MMMDLSRSRGGRSTGSSPVPNNGRSGTAARERSALTAGALPGGPRPMSSRSSSRASTGSEAMQGMMGEIQGSYLSRLQKLEGAEAGSADANKVKPATNSPRQTTPVQMQYSYIII